MPRKYFTLAEANRTLPPVSQIVSELVSFPPSWATLEPVDAPVLAGARAERGASTGQLPLRARLVEVARQISDYLTELEQVGRVFKGFPERHGDVCGRPHGTAMYW